MHPATDPRLFTRRCGCCAGAAVVAPTAGSCCTCACCRASARLGDASMGANASAACIGRRLSCGLPTRIGLSLSMCCLRSPVCLDTVRLNCPLSVSLRTLLRTLVAIVSASQSVARLTPARVLVCCTEVQPRAAPPRLPRPARPAAEVWAG